MSNGSFFNEPYDAGTLSKLKIFELYIQEWIPVFLSNPTPPFKEIHIFDFFTGPGEDAEHNPGSPLRILQQLKQYQEGGKLHGWNAVRINVHLSDQSKKAITLLEKTLTKPEWQIPGVALDIKTLSFEEALAANKNILEDGTFAKLLIIDQFGVNAVTDEVFKYLVSLPKTDFMFFLASTTLNRFRNDPSIKVKIEDIDKSHEVHRVATKAFKKMLPSTPRAYLASFSIKKEKGNIYGIIFCTKHPLGISKFLNVAWKSDSISGEANYDIDDHRVASHEMTLPLGALFSPKKIEVFKNELRQAIISGVVKNESDIMDFCFEYGVRCQHSQSVIEELKNTGMVKCDFKSPNVDNYKEPRGLELTKG